MLHERRLVVSTGPRKDLLDLPYMSRDDVVSITSSVAMTQGRRSLFVGGDCFRIFVAPLIRMARARV